MNSKQIGFKKWLDWEQHTGVLLFVFLVLFFVYYLLHVSSPFFHELFYQTIWGQLSSS